MEIHIYPEDEMEKKLFVIEKQRHRTHLQEFRREED